MNMESQTSCLRATVAVDGRLLSADEPLLALQRQAGGDLNGALAIPQLAAIARLASRFGITISRPIVAASDRGDIDMWVRARPGDSAVHIAIIDWTERAARPPLGDAADRDADLAQLAEGWRWEIDPQMRFRDAVEEEATPDPRPVPGTPFGGYFRLHPDESGAMPLLEGLALRRAFRGQQAALVADADRWLALSGFPLFDLDGRLMGFRGKAAAVSGAMAPAPDPAPDTTPYSAEFGKRLDRSLRQPLGRIIANADSISAQLEGPLRPDYADYASDIAAAGRHLMALVDDLADLQAIDRPDFAVAAEPVDLADIARRAAGLLNVKAADRHIHLVPPPAGYCVPATGEFRRVLQILVNLVGNAIRYSPEHSDVRILAEVYDQGACVMVIDQGPGIGADSQERIFEKFERLGRDDAGGSGLGLYISRRLARAMGGDIRVESAPGEGASFILTLPR